MAVHQTAQCASLQTILQATTSHFGSCDCLQVVFRHGARTPLTNLYWPEQQWTSCTAQHPGSINISLYDSAGGIEVPNVTDLETAPDLPGGCKMGRLTDNGYLMAEHLGRALRQRYIHHHKLLPEQYTPTAVQVNGECSRGQQGWLSMYGCQTTHYQDAVI